jgi:hypothetical protein
MSLDLKPPASPIDVLTSIGHQPSERFRKPDSDPAYGNCSGW